MLNAAVKCGYDSTSYFIQCFKNILNYAIDIHKNGEPLTFFVSVIMKDFIKIVILKIQTAH